MPDDEKQTLALHRLTGPPYFLATEEAEVWLEKHGAVAVLGGIAKLERVESEGKVIGHKVPYLEAILAERKQAARGHRSTGEPAIKHPIDWHFDILRRDADAAGVERPGEYADDVMRSQQLAREIAAMEEGPERDGLVAEWRKLP